MAKQLSVLSGKVLENLKNILESTKETSVYEDLSNIAKSLEELDNLIKNLNFEQEPTELKPEEVGLEKEHKLRKIGSGKFGAVYKSSLKGQPVAVKVQITQNDEENSDFSEGSATNFSEESKTLRSLRHDNIIAFRGSGIFNKQVFIVMEYIEITLMKYIRSTVTDDGSGLSDFRTWHIAHQVANAMDYLHSQGIFHRDLRPENILDNAVKIPLNSVIPNMTILAKTKQCDGLFSKLDTKPIYPVAKLCDFGLSCHNVSTDDSEGHVRYSAPKGWNKEKRDVFAFGLVVFTTKSGKRPWEEMSTQYFSQGQQHEIRLSDNKSLYIDDVKVSISDGSAGGKINQLIWQCCGDVEKCPNFQKIVADHFSDENPFKLKESKGEFFSCGFLMNTSIFVVDSMVKEVDEHVTMEELFNSPKPTYVEKNLLCLVERHSEEEHPIEDHLDKMYIKNKKEYLQKAKQKIIDNNPNIALKKIVLDREGEEESQHIELRFKQSTYCHHRAIRDIWRSFDEIEKSNIVPDKGEVNKIYSTSFGLHVAVLTKEGGGKRKFVFTQRSRAKGVASPGAYTCGAVESCSILDYLDKDADPATVSLVRTAARGLTEELGLPLDNEDSKAIHLNTVYLKFDTHEWGMCGFIDLNDERVKSDHQLSFEQVKSAFTWGPKDKFEHSSIEGVDFNLNTMTEWIRDHHDQMASSGKIAVVKVMQAYFGTAQVTKEFEKYLPK